MPKGITAMSHFGVHTQDDNGSLVSLIAGGYAIVSTDTTTTIKTLDDQQAVVFPRDLVELMVEMLRSHGPADDHEDYDDLTDEEAETRLP